MRLAGVARSTAAKAAAAPALIRGTGNAASGTFGGHHLEHLEADAVRAPPVSW